MDVSKWANPLREEKENMRTKLRSKFSLLFVAFALVLAMPAVALADTLEINDLETGANTTKAPGATGSAKFWLIANSSPGGDLGGCNVDSSNPATVTVTSSDTNKVTIDGTGQAQLTACKDGSVLNAATVGYTVKTGATSGIVTISGSVSGGKAGSKYNNDSFTVTIDAPTPPADTTPPVISKVVTGTLGNNGWYTSNVGVDWTVTDNESTISSQSGCDDFSVTSDQNATTYTCTATSAGGTASESVTIKRDATPPQINDDGTQQTPNGAGWYNSAVSNNFSASDATSGLANLANASFSKSSGTNEGIAVKINSGAVSDLAGNTNTGIDSVAFKIDLSDPYNVALNGNISDGASFDFGEVPAAPTCSADDDISGLKDCIVSGYSSAVGTHTLTATATDNAGRTSTKQISYTVRSWKLTGLYAPVDYGMLSANNVGSIVNTVKNGSTVPLKFEVFKRDANNTELTDTAIVNTPLKATKVSCASGATEDAIELTATGATSLRYDATGGQFIYNWKTPTQVGACYQVSVSTKDGSSTPIAQFKLK